VSTTERMTSEELEDCDDESPTIGYRVAVEWFKTWVKDGKIVPNESEARIDLSARICDAIEVSGGNP